MTKSRKLAVIGTAGRDASKPLNLDLWTAMVDDLQVRILPTDTLVSGGAAWADHLAVHAYLQGWCAGLALYFPAPFSFRMGRFIGPVRSSADVANHYHHLFDKSTGIDSRGQICKAIQMGASVSAEPPSPGIGGMFARNSKIAANATSVLAYTFSTGYEPPKGGTLDTWKKFASTNRVHVRLGDLLGRPASLIPK